MRALSRSSASRVSTALALSALGLALASACSNEEIVLATVGASEAGTGTGTGTRCVENKDCEATMFCARRDCGDAAGTCELRPVVCDEAPMPVCGCDGITYWNDCLRRTVGSTSMRPGECSGNARLCGKDGKPGGGPGGGGRDACPPGTACARLLPPPDPGAPALCPPIVGGTCWALPAVCPERSGPDRWLSCDPARTACISTCDAIRSGEPYARAFACP